MYDIFTAVLNFAKQHIHSGDFKITMHPLDMSLLP